MALQFAVESGRSIRDEVFSLTQLHWEEIALDKDKITLAPNYERYEELDAMGVLHTITAREAGKLVGYHFSFIQPHLHYRNDLMCFTDIFFLHPEHRKGLAAFGLFRAVETEMKKIGVKKIIMGCKDHHNLAPIFNRLGWTLTDHMYAKYIGE